MTKFNTPPKERLGNTQTGYAASVYTEITAAPTTVPDDLTEVKTRIMEILSRLRVVEIAIENDDQIKFPNQNFGTMKVQGSLQFGNLADMGEGFSGLRIDYPPYDDGTKEWLWSGLNNDSVVSGVDTTGGGYFSQGTIGGWSLAYESFTADSGNAFLTSGSSSGSPAIGLGATAYETGTGCWFGKDTDGVYKAFIGDAGGHHITWNGSIFEVVGSITAPLGNIGGWTIGTTSLTAGTGGTTVGLDSGGINPAIYAGSATPGSAPARIYNNGDAYFQNVNVNGMLHTVVFSKDTISGTAGTLGIYKSAGKLKTAVNLTTVTSIDIEDPASGHATVFEVDDILRIKNGTLDVWLKVSAITDWTTWYSYTVSNVYGDNSGTILSGTAVIDYGISGDGYIILTADDTNAPFMSVMGHSGSPWSDAVTYIRTGNQNGFLGETVKKFGIGIGDSNTNLKYNPTDKLRLSFAGSKINFNELGQDFSVQNVEDIDNPARITWTKPGNNFISGCIWAFWQAAGAYEDLILKIFAGTTDATDGGCGQVYVGSAKNDIADYLWNAYTRWYGSGDDGYADTYATLIRFLKGRTTGGDVVIEGALASGSPEGGTMVAGTHKFFDIASTPSNGSQAGTHTLYAMVDGMYYMDADGTEHQVNDADKLQGVSIDVAAPTATDFLYYDGATWTPIVHPQANGWQQCRETWTYVSATSVVVDGDKSAKYQKGDKVKFTQTTIKFFYITAVTYNAGPNTTTLTLNGGSDYSVATPTAISANQFSRESDPFGFPAYFNYTVTWSSASNPQPTIVNGTLTGIFKIEGTHIWIRVLWTAGASTTFGNGQYRFTPPVTINWAAGVAQLLDSGTTAAQGYVTISGGNFVVYKYDGANAITHSTPWTWAVNDQIWFTINGTI